MKHPQAFVILIVVVMALTGVLLWTGSVWGALGALVGGLTLAFVISMAWLWSPAAEAMRSLRCTAPGTVPSSKAIT